MTLIHRLKPTKDSLHDFTRGFLKSLLIIYGIITIKYCCGWQTI